MARNYWQTKRKTIETKKINKKLVLPAFTYSCFFPHRSMKSTDNITGKAVNLLGGFDCRNAFTVELWAFTYTNLDGTIYSNVTVDDHDPTVKIDISGGLIRASIIDIGQIIRNIAPPDAQVPVGQWFHVAVTYDGTTVKLYINGLTKDAWSTTVAAPLHGDGNYLLYLFADNPDSIIFRGYIDELRIWDSARSASDILFFRNKHIQPDTSGLLFNYNFDDVVQTGATAWDIPNDITGGADWSYSGTDIEFSTTNIAPIVLGTSFVVAEYSVSLGKSISLKYPINNPEDSDLNFGLYLSWFDINDTFQRRKLFTISGIEIAPNIVDYAGEILTDPFKFEIWNIDGEAAVSLSSDLTMKISDTSLPTGDTDHTEVAAATLTGDNNLAEPYPLTNFPLEFNSQQTY